MFMFILISLPLMLPHFHFSQSPQHPPCLLFWLLGTKSNLKKGEVEWHMKRPGVVGNYNP